MTEKFFIPAPDLDTARPKLLASLNGGKPYAVFTYEDAEGFSLIWSAAFGLPAVGETVFVTMNDIGYAVVKGYFGSYLDDGTAYLGVMTYAICPPEYLVRQQADRQSDPRVPEWSKRGIGCEFGTEVRVLRGGETVPSVAALAAERKRKAAAWKRKVAKERKAEQAEREARWAAAEPAPLHKSGLTAEEIHAERAASALADLEFAEVKVGREPEIGTPLYDWFGRELPSGE